MKRKVGLALCGSYCTYDRVLAVAKTLCDTYDIVPIMSETSAATDSRFGKAADFKDRLQAMTGRSIIDTVSAAEPIGPKGILDILVIAPCTGNTIAKIACGVTDSTVTMAAKAHLRNEKPLIIAVSTNDGLSGNAGNIGALLSRKNVYFVPFGQDDPHNKPTSLVACFEQIADTIELAAKGKQIQPILLNPCIYQ